MASLPLSQADKAAEVNHNRVGSRKDKLDTAGEAGFNQGFNMNSIYTERKVVAEGIDVHMEAIGVWSRREARGVVEPEDLAQQAVMALLKAKEQKTQPMTRAYAVIRAQGEMRNERQSAMRHVRSEQPISPDKVPAASKHHPDVPARLAEMKALLDQCMEGLPERQRQVVDALYNEGLSNTEVAERMQLNEPHVSKLHHSALLTMREKLAEKRVHSFSNIF